MINTLFSLVKPILHRLEPEAAHDLTLEMLAIISKILPQARTKNACAIIKSGLAFPNRLGLAAGFDKNATAAEALLKIGFGFVEIGTVTPKPQIGNPKPRLFRLKEDQAVINRMGFNNDGAEIIAKRMDKIRHKGNQGIIGVNIGANKDSDDRIADYAKSAAYFLDTASYFTVNVSSPNTHGLRNLQGTEFLDKLLNDVLSVAHKHKNMPVFLKIAPDRQDYDLEAIIQLINQLPVAGLIASNTTISRPESLKSKHAHEAGGLSGKPLFDISTALIKDIKQSLNADKMLIGVGGIASSTDAQAKLQAGADAIQLYSALVYQGKKLVDDILQEI